MPYSDATFDKEVEKVIRQKEYIHFLDIGAGAGKYGKMIRELRADATVDAIEIEEAYVNRFDLPSIYDHVFVESVISYIDTNVDFCYDVCIIGDCIEHLKKSDGIDLIEFLLYRSKQIVLVFPSRLVQYSWNDFKNEAHRSVWRETDFEGLQAAYQEKNGMNFVTVRGFL